jgi:aryl-alcohol dehydrogenase-like predicted oxidoreductase
MTSEGNPQMAETFVKNSPWTHGRIVLGCGLFGGVGGSAQLIGRGMDELAAFATMDEAVELGITLFDTAEVYAGGASEIMIGNWLAEQTSEVASRVLLATKVAPGFLFGHEAQFGDAYLEVKFAASLQRLGVEAVEILYTHRPDDATPIEDTLVGLENIRASGRCRQLGACNVDEFQLTAALDAAERLGFKGYQVVQNRYSLLQPEQDRAVRILCAERGIPYVAYSPLASGVLTGKYPRFGKLPPESRLALRPDSTNDLLTPAMHDVIDRLRDEAIGRGIDCGALALAWLLDRSYVTAPIIGPGRSAPHLSLAAQALEVSLSETDAQEIESWFVSATAEHISN